LPPAAVLSDEASAVQAKEGDEKMGDDPTRIARSVAIDTLRQRFSASGEVPEADLPTPVLRSWVRCHRLGMEMGERVRPPSTTRGDLMVARERSAMLLEHAAGVMEHLHEQIRASGSMVLLADASGLILHGIGDPAFVDRANRVALQPGANWSECERGTNAIGATLVERAAVEVLGSEHYLDCNGVLTCSAAPILDWRGELLGALDISGDHRNHQPHTLGLARMGVRLVERRLFESEHARHALLSFHPRPEGVGGLQEGLLAIDPDGEIVAADHQARVLLGIADRRPVRMGGFSSLFRSSFGTVIGRAARDPAALIELELRAGKPGLADRRAAGAGRRWRARGGCSRPVALRAPPGHARDLVYRRRGAAVRARPLRAHRRPQHPDPDPRRIGFRQGAPRACLPPQRAARRGTLCRGQLRGDPREPD
jgi:PAS domain-containing protein